MPSMPERDTVPFAHQWTPCSYSRGRRTAFFDGRSSWHNWALGVQFYDDALDVEDDFRNRNLTWAVGRTLEYFHRSADNPATQRMPDPDTFYERALAGGVVSEALSHAESFFAESARLAEPAFPSWVPFQMACVSQAGRLREDYEKLVIGA
jgi:hypothetical protein